MWADEWTIAFFGGGMGWGREPQGEGRETHYHILKTTWRKEILIAFGF